MGTPPLQGFAKQEVKQTPCAFLFESTGYGRHKYGQSLLLARRLVEAGVRLVTVYWGGKVNNPLPHWDTHFNNNRRLRDELLPPLDQCLSAFLEDLEARGLLRSTLVVFSGECGRSPRFG